MIRFDREALSRQRFWYGVCAFLVVWLIGLMVVGSADSEIKQVKEKYEKYGRDVKQATDSNPTNPTFDKLWNDAKKDYVDRKDVVHKEAWDLQKALLTWPSSKDAPLQAVWDSADSWKDWYDTFVPPPDNPPMANVPGGNPPAAEKPRPNRYNAGNGAWLNDYMVQLYRRQFSDLYNSMNGTAETNPPLEKIVAPVEFRNGIKGFETMMAPAAGSLGRRDATAPDAKTSDRTISKFFDKVPSVEELWYAQEDFWFKREVLLAVRRCLDAVSQFTREEKGFWANLANLVEHPDRPFSPRAPVAGPAEMGRKYVPEAECRFRNGNWELHLFFEEDTNGNLYISGNSTLMNVTRRTLAGTRPSKETKARDPKAGPGVGPGAAPAASGTREPLQFFLTQKADAGVKTRRTYMLEVKLPDMEPNRPDTFKEAKKINTNLDPRKPFDVEQVFDWHSAPIRRIDDIKTCVHSHRDAHVQLKTHPILGKKVEAPAVPAVPVPGAPATPQGTAAAFAMPQPLREPTEDNYLERNRYLNVTDTCRDLPFAVVLVVEQTHLNDFLVQLANSPLRIQITQVQAQRVRNVGPTPPPVAADGPQRGAPEPPRVTDPNLVEVTVYGIAAMYEKFSVQKAGKQ